MESGYLMRSVRAVSIFVLMLMASLSVLIAGCSESEASDDESAGSASAISANAGVVLSLSGPNASYGEPTKAGIELALAEMDDDDGSVGISATYLDDEGNAESGAERFQELIDDGVSAILGPTLSNTAFEAHPVAQAAGVPVIAVTNTADGITDTGEYIFRVSLAEADVIPQTVETVVDEFEPATAALVFSSDDAWSASSADTFRAAAEEHGIEILIEEDVPSDGGDFSESVANIGEADPDIIILTALEHSSIGVVREARKQGLEQRIVCGNGCNTGTFIEETGDASEGLVVGSAWHLDVENNLSEAFVESYREEHGEDPDQFSAQGYAGIQVLRAALVEAESGEPDDVRDALANLGEVETVLGTFSFDENRDAQHPAVIKIVEDGEFAILK